MSAGMMPALDWPGLIRPGQFGPIRRTPAASARARKETVSWTGTPSVMTTTRPTPASTASSTASLTKRGGTKTTLTSAPVAPAASLTLPKTGSSAPSKETAVPALRGLTPPTTVLPAASMRRVCRMPSAPVMPCTMILLSRLRKIDMSAPSLGCGRQFRGALRGAVHGVELGDERVRGGGQDRPARLGAVAVQADDERLGQLDLAQGLDDAVGDRVAGGDAAEDVDEDGPHVKIAQDDSKAFGHDPRGGAAADVEEVGGRGAAAGDHVEGGHHQPRAVSDHADLPVELDVVEAFGAGGGFQQVP